MNIALIGYGRMGKQIEEIALKQNHQIVLKIDANNSTELTNENLAKSDVAIEFSTPGNAYFNILKWGPPGTGFNWTLISSKR